jgi:hypothetical protein
VKNEIKTFKYFYQRGMWTKHTHQKIGCFAFEQRWPKLTHAHPRQTVFYIHLCDSSNDHLVNTMCHEDMLQFQNQLFLLNGIMVFDYMRCQVPCISEENVTRCIMWTTCCMPHCLFMLWILWHIICVNMSLTCRNLKHSLSKLYSWCCILAKIGSVGNGLVDAFKFPTN